MKKIILIGLLLTLLIGCTQTPEEKIDSLFQEAVTQINSYNFEKARGTMDQIGEIDPASPYILYCNALIKERQLCFADAAHEYMVIGTIAPTFVPALEGVVRTFSRLDEYILAARAAKDAVELKPGDPYLQLRLAEVLIDAGQIRGAADAVESAESFGVSGTVADLIRPRLYFSLKDVDTALVLKEAALAAAGKSLDDYRAAAELCETFDLADSAVMFSRRALEVSDYHPDVLLDHFFRCLRLKYFFEARKVIDLIPSDGGGEIARSGLRLHLYMADSDRPKVIAETSKYRALTKSAINSVFLDILARTGAGDFLSADSDEDFIIQTLTNGNYIRDFIDFMTYKLATSKSMMMFTREKLDELQKLPREYLNSRDVQLQIAQLMHRTGDFDGYEDLISTLEEYNRNKPDWLSGIADIYSQRNVGKNREAEQLYRRALELDPWYRPAFEGWVDMRRRSRQFDQALGLFDEYSTLASIFPSLRSLKAMILAEKGDVENAWTLFKEYYPLAPGDLTVPSELIDWATLHDKPEVIDSVISLLSTQKENASALQLAAQAACGLGEFQKGLDLIEAAIAIRDTEVDPYAVKAWALHGLGRTSEAFDLFEENRTRDRDNILNGFLHSYLLGKDKIDLERAANIAREVLGSSGFRLDTWMNLCFIYYQAGRYDLSRGEALKASHTYINRPEPFYRLGLAMAAEGTEGAKENLQKAIVLGLAGDDLRTAQEWINKL